MKHMKKISLLLAAVMVMAVAMFTMSGCQDEPLQGAPADIIGTWTLVSYHSEGEDVFEPFVQGNTESGWTDLKIQLIVEDDTNVCWAKEYKKNGKTNVIKDTENAFTYTYREGHIHFDGGPALKAEAREDTLIIPTTKAEMKFVKEK